MGDIERIAQQALENAIRKMAVEVVEHNAGWGIETEMRAVIKLHVEKLMDTDKELKRMLKDKLVYWIERQ